MPERARVSGTGPGEYRVTGLLDLDTVAPCKQYGQSVLRRENGPVTFDLGGAEVKGSAVIALLIAWQREAERMDKEVSFVNCSKKLLDIAEACGVREILFCG